MYAAHCQIMALSGYDARARYPKEVRCFRVVPLLAALLCAQSDTGELRVKVTDQDGLPIQSSVEITSQANQVRQQLETDANGAAAVKRLPFGIYHVEVKRTGFTNFSDLVEIR